jgi:DNA-directed RNA polymerase subunit M/transcription elongation factor TFIIS
MRSNIKLTNEDVDIKLIADNREIKRLGDYIDAKTKILWQCLICQYIWSATPGNILNGKKGCPKCGGKVKLTNEIVDRRLYETNRSIKRLGEIINAIIKIEWECLIENCKYKWNATPHSILNGNKSGCPRCGKRKPWPKYLKRKDPSRSRPNKMDNENVDRRLKEANRDIRRLSDFTSATMKGDWQCLICQYIWITIPHSILNHETGCPKCSGRLKLTNEDIDRRLIDNCRLIKRLGDIINVMTKIPWQCLVEECQFIWETAPDAILNGNSGCPKCSLCKNEKLTLLILEQNNLGFEPQVSLRRVNKTAKLRFRFDAYSFQINTAIEYNGKQHYNPTTYFGGDKNNAGANFIVQQKRDAYKQAFCAENNINLISIDGRKYQGKKLEKYLIDELIPQLKAMPIITP